VTPGGIYFMAGRELRRFSFETGASKTILTLPLRAPGIESASRGREGGLGLTVSPDEQWLLYTQMDQGGSDLMLVENFR
jgi:hypothetical protein